MGLDHGVCHPIYLLAGQIPNHRKNEVFDDPACPPEWPKVADTVIEAKKTSVKIDTKTGVEL
jgi:hypothetical protein